MKKITVVVQEKDIDTTLNALGKAGVLHIEHENLPADKDTQEIDDKIRSLTKAIQCLPDVTSEDIPSDNLDGLIDRAHILIDEKEVVLENLKRIKKDIAVWEEWGDFDPDLIDYLKNKNIWVQLCKITKKEIEQIPQGVVLEKLFKKGNIFYCAVVSREEIQLPFQAISLPEESLGAMVNAREKGESKSTVIDKELSGIARYKNALVAYEHRLFSLMEFTKARSGMGKFEMLSYIKGYCPVFNVSFLEKLAIKERWAILVEETDENDIIPTLIKNPGWIEMIRPVFQMIKILPGYNEVDMSFWFLLFFSVFFGMLVGDAGYGAVFFLVNLICHIKFRDKVKNRAVFFLIYVLSLCAIAWGVLTGTFFGQAYLAKKVEPLLPFLRENSNIQALCFFIGAIHLSIAHLWKFIRKWPSLQAFSDAGWVLVLWAAYFLANALILGQAFPEIGRYLLIIGAGLIVFFTSPGRNIFKAIGSGIGNLLLHIVNSFTDIVSYIRLFAVGVATVAVADAFNQIAGNIGYSSIFTCLATALILLLGHTLNIMLGAMAILVHGVRLNVLEFSSHLDMEWSGVEYKPFSESK